MWTRYALKQFVMQTCSRYIKWSTVSGPGGRFGFLRVTLPLEAPELGEKTQTQAVRLLQHYGHRGQPVSGSEVLVLAPRGGTSNAVAVASDNLAHGRTDLKEGESQQYCKATGTEVFLSAEGKVAVNAAAGQDVVVNAGTLNVARKNDPVGFLTVTTANVGLMGAPVVVSVTWSRTPAFPAPVPPVVEIPLFITDGAPHFKG